MAANKPAAASGRDDGCMLGIVVFGIILFLGTIGRCSQETGGSAETLYNAANQDLGNAIAAQQPEAPQPLDAEGVERGVVHLNFAVSLEGFAGAMIYSQNCYDALAFRFSWSKLDQCGGFDMLAVRSIAQADSAGLINEPGYFEGESAAARYLAAATGAGQDPAAADMRLSDLQARVAALPLARQIEGPAEVDQGNPATDPVDPDGNPINLLEALE